MEHNPKTKDFTNPKSEHCFHILLGHGGIPMIFLCLAVLFGLLLHSFKVMLQRLDFHREPPIQIAVCRVVAVLMAPFSPGINGFGLE